MSTERAVQTCKELMRKVLGNTIETKLHRAFSYRITPQSTTGQTKYTLTSPAKFKPNNKFKKSTMTNMLK